MGNMGGKKHLKRLSAPKTWKILRKAATFTIRPMPGPHSKDDSISLAVALRDITGFVQTRKEGKYLLNKKEVKVDGREVTEEKFPIGFMDVVQIKDKTYRVVFDKLGRLTLVEDVDQPNVKLCRIVNKYKVKGGKTQLCLHDGRTILVDSDEYKVGDSILIEVPSQKILKHIKLDENNLVYIYKGKHTGKIGKLKEIVKGNMSHPSKIVIVLDDGTELSTLKEYGFVIGEKESEIKVI